jgi:hypothetical protein
MVEQIQLIERLEGVRRILKSNPDLADVILLGMIEEAEKKVSEFEEYFGQKEVDTVAA